MKLVKAEPEAEFDSTMLSVMFKLQNQITYNGELESKLSDFAMCKHLYTTHLTAEIPGNRRLHGNAYSKQNNWRVISHLNPGLVKGGNTYGEHSLQFIKN